MALIEVAPSITWLLVSTSPVEVSTIPVPAALPPWYPSVDTTSTTPGFTFAAICDVVSAVAPIASAAPSPANISAATPADAPASKAWRRHGRPPRPLPCSCSGPPMTGS
jgi:hypothetical protein